MQITNNPHLPVVTINSLQPKVFLPYCARLALYSLLRMVEHVERYAIRNTQEALKEHVEQSAIEHVRAIHKIHSDHFFTRLLNSLRSHSKNNLSPNPPL